MIGNATEKYTQRGVVSHPACRARLWLQCAHVRLLQLSFFASCLSSSWSAVPWGNVCCSPWWASPPATPPPPTGPPFWLRRVPECLACERELSTLSEAQGRLKSTRPTLTHNLCPSCVPALWLHVNVTWATPEWSAALQLPAGARRGTGPRHVSLAWELSRQSVPFLRHSACWRPRHRVDGD